MTKRGFREYDVSDAEQGARFGFPNPKATIALMAKAHVPTSLGRQYIRCGIFLMAVKNKMVMQITIGPRDWIKPNMLPPWENQPRRADSQNPSPNE